MATLGLGALAACSGGSGLLEASKYKSPAEVGAAMVAAGLCSDYADLPDLDSVASEYETARGRCTVDGEKATVVFYKDPGARDNAVRFAGIFGCGFKIGNQPARSGFDFVQGAVWTVSASTETTAKRIAVALGADHKHVAC